jgi:nicastrin
VNIVAVVAESMFSILNYERLNKTDGVVGIVVLYDSNGTTSLAPFSPDNRFADGASFPFNAAGVQPGFMFKSFRVPMFSCRDDDTSLKILNKAKDNVARQYAYPQWGVKLNAHMDAGVNAETCLRREFCQPIGGQSVWAARRPIIRPDAPAPVNASAEFLRSQRPIVLLSAGFDSNSIFQDVAIGARSDMAPLVVALAVLDALAHSGINDSVWDEAPRQPLFAFFTGEAWNQMGSKAFFRDVAKFDCRQPTSDGVSCLDPYVTTLDFQDISLDNVALMMHLSSDLGVTEAQQVFWHIGNGTDSPLAALVRQELALSTAVSTPAANVTSLPPSALVSARRHRPTLPGVVLGGFDDRFNSRYHSRLDDARGAITKNLCPTAGAVARAFVSALLVNDTATAPPPQRNNTVLESLQVNCTLVDALWHCLVEDALCDLLRETLFNVRARKDGVARPTHYVGVHSKNNAPRDYWAPFISAFASWRLKLRVGQECTGDKQCAKTEKCVMSACVYANVQYHDALPEGLVYNYNEDVYVVQPTGDVWVESNWDGGIGMQLYKGGSESAAIAFLVFGLALTIGSFAALIVAKKKVAKQFKLV